MEASSRADREVLSCASEKVRPRDITCGGGGVFGRCGKAVS